MMEYTRCSHEFPPVWDSNSSILILGSFPSVKSREEGFFYGHPRNRFWKVLANVFDEDEPLTIEEKKQFLLSNGIALWDVIESCDIKGSSDSSIRNVIANDFTEILQQTKVRTIIANGRTAGKLYDKYALEKTKIPAIVLPSTSPANAAFTLEVLTESYRKVIKGD